MLPATFLIIYHAAYVSILPLIDYRAAHFLLSRHLLQYSFFDLVLLSLHSKIHLRIDLLRS